MPQAYLLGPLIPELKRITRPSHERSPAPSTLIRVALHRLRRLPAHSRFGRGWNLPRDDRQPADPDFFISHADITLIQARPRDDTSLHDELTPLHAMLEAFQTMPKATIAVIEGIARGGGSELAMAFDMRFATLEKAGSRHSRSTSSPRPSGPSTPRSVTSSCAKPCTRQR